MSFHVPGADDAASSVDPCSVIGDVTIKCSLRQSCDGVALDEQRGIVKDRETLARVVERDDGRAFVKNSSRDSKR